MRKLNDMSATKFTYITKNLNDSGIFLEFAFQEFAQEYKPFQQIETQIPFTIDYTGSQPIDGTVDFLCLYQSKGQPTIYFIVECKKADPSQKNWIFFQRNEGEKGSTAFYRSYKKTPSGSIATPNCLSYPQEKSLYDRSYQIVGSKGTHAFNDQKKDPVYNASIQVSKGLRSIIEDDGHNPERLLPSVTEFVFFVPVVVTTAEIMSWKTDFSVPDLATGEADVSKLTYENEKWIEYSAPIPKYLRIRNIDRSSVYIVNSCHLNEFFSTIAQEMVYAHKEIESKK